MLKSFFSKNVFFVMTKDQAIALINQKYLALQQKARFILGYPCNSALNDKDFKDFLNLSLNNLGDPFSNSNYGINTHDFELQVLAYIAELYDAQNDYWGYISSGGTEGNILGIHLGRLHYPTGYIYYSQHSHYSIPKAINLTRSHSIEIPVQPSGEMDYTALATALKNNNHPAIIIANIGTTMTGAIDNIKLIKTTLHQAGIKDYYIHCDAALHGLILPFRQNPKMFNLAAIDSLTISGHKLIGSPLPCGIFLCRKNVIKNFDKYIEYVQTPDMTIAGSRNGLTPLILWQKFLAHNDLKNIVDLVIERADYTIQKFQNKHMHAWRNEDSPIVIFPSPSMKIVKKWMLAQQGDIAHIVTMPHVDEAMIDAFVEDMFLDKDTP